MYDRLHVNLTMAQLLMEKGRVLTVGRAASLYGGNAAGYQSLQPSVNSSCI